MSRIEAWNDISHIESTMLASEASQASVFIFSTHLVLRGILDNPAKHVFDGDVEQAGGAIWRDELHLRSAVHEISAIHLEKVSSPLRREIMNH